MNSAICQALLRSIIYVDLKTIPNTSDRKISLKVTAPTLSSNMPTVTMGVAPPAGNGLLAFAREQAPKPPPQGGPPAVQPRILHFGLEVDDVNLMLDFIQALENKGYNTAADLFSFYLGRKGKTQDDVDLYLDRDYQANEVRIHARNMVRKLIIDECSKRNLGFYKAGTFDLSISSGGTFNPWPRKVRFYPSDDIGQIMTPSNDNPIRWYSIDDNMFYAFGGCNFTLEGHVTVTPFIHRVRNRSYADAIISCPDLVVKINDSFRFFGGSVLDSDTTLSFAVQDAASVLSYRAVVLKAGIFLERRFGYAGFLNHIGYEDPLTFNLSDYWIGSR